MAVRPPSQYAQGSAGSGTPETGLDLLDHEIMAEKASSLGRAGRRAEECLARLRAHQGEPEERAGLRKQAADAVHAYFIQRELCGLRRHREIIRELAIPDEVLVRLGAS
jgi:hypothetical protein